MGVYVYTARATGRKRVFVDGGMHWVFPLEYSYKPNWFDSKWNDRMNDAAWRQSQRVLHHPDFEGYVQIYDKIYRGGPTLWYDCDKPIGVLVE